MIIRESIIIFIVCLLILITPATKDVVDAIFDASNFLPLNDGNALVYLMGQSYNRLQSDIKNIQEADPLYKVIRKNERTTDSGKTNKADLAKLLVKFDAIIKHHLAESPGHCADIETGLVSIFYYKAPAIDLCLLLNPFLDYNVLQNELEISGNFGKEINGHADDVIEQGMEIDIGDQESTEDPVKDEPGSEDDEDLIIDEEEGNQDDVSSYLRRTSILQRNYNEEEPNVIRLRFDIYIPPNRDVDWIRDRLRGVNAHDDVRQFVMELNGQASMHSHVSFRRCRRFHDFWSRYFGATLLYSYPLDEQDVIVHAQQLLSNSILN